MLSNETKYKSKEKKRLTVSQQCCQAQLLIRKKSLFIILRCIIILSRNLSLRRNCIAF